MAGGLMGRLRILIVAVCMAATAAAPAQALRDPTRPAIGKGTIAASSEPSGWILQSVLISPVRRYAIINGEVVALGGSVAGAELLSIAPERVTLRTREGLRVVYLFPDVTRLDVAKPGGGETNLKPAPDSEQGTRAERSGTSGRKK